MAKCYNYSNQTDQEAGSGRRGVGYIGFAVNVWR